MNTAVLFLDAVGMGFFATSGAAIAVDTGASWFAAGILGMLTAIAGGMLRDVVAREVPYVMGPDDLYAIPAMLGAVTYVLIDYFGPQWLGIVVGSAVATLLRLGKLGRVGGSDPEFGGHSWTTRRRGTYPPSDPRLIGELQARPFAMVLQRQLDQPVDQTRQGKAAASHSFGYMLIAVKPGIVFTSLTKISLQVALAQGNPPAPSRADDSALKAATGHRANALGDLAREVFAGFELGAFGIDVLRFVTVEIVTALISNSPGIEASGRSLPSTAHSNSRPSHEASISALRSY